MMWSVVELREIRVFLTLADELHFGRTAERVQLTSSRVSQILRDLERKLGVQLVHRTSRRVELTPAGARFLDEARPAYAELTDVLERTQAANNGRRKPVIRVGTFSVLATGPHFVSILRAFAARYPRCVVDVQQMRPEDFGKRDADIMAMWLPHAQPDLVVGPTLVQEPRVLAVSADHALAKRSSVSVEELADYCVGHVPGLATEFHDAWVPSKTASGRPIPSELLDISPSGDLGDMTLELGYRVASGRLVHPTVPSLVKVWGHLDIAYVPINDMPPMRSALVWPRGATDPTVRDFIRTAREILRDRADGAVRQ